MDRLIALIQYHHLVPVSARFHNTGVGFDQLYQFHRWRKYSEILDKCRLLVILRRGIDHERLMGFFPKELEPFKDAIRIHEMYPTAISSSRLRIMIQRNDSIASYVPKSVSLIIEKNLL